LIFAITTPVASQFSLIQASNANFSTGRMAPEVTLPIGNAKASSLQESQAPPAMAILS
jgi:hypothetical protein